MGRRILLFLLLFLSFGIKSHSQYRPDILGKNFVQQTIQMPDDYEGKVITTIIRKNAEKPTEKAILYVHGFNDYFFQTSLAEHFNHAGFNFYAVDLRKYGRSILTNQYPFQVHNLKEYFADIDTTLQIIRQEGNQEILLMGHSTGGLITSLFCQKYRNNLPVQGLILNSPFLDMNQSWFKEKILIPIVSFFATFSKKTKIKQGISTAYGESLLKQYHGEWDYDTTKKFMQSPALTTGWIHAIHRGQKKIHRGLNIPCPILVLYSSQSIYGDNWTPEHQNGDGVLDVKDIAKYGKRLGPKVTEVEIKEGMHDLILSKKEARNATYKAIFDWIKQNRF
ncbi:alpha/beta hydrolase [Coprobacter sp.]